MVRRNPWQGWSHQASKLVWSLAVVSSASAGLFFGANYAAQSDISKFSALLAQHERVPGEVIVKLSKEGQASMNAMGAGAVFAQGNFQITTMNAFETDASLFKVKLRNDADTAAFLDALSQNSAVAHAEPNYIYRISVDKPSIQDVTPNDASFGLLWGLKNSGQKDAEGTEGLVGADIGATKAWEITTGKQDFLVAVIDTGVDYNHPDLKDNIYANPGESGEGKETNGVDDDGNGFVDDFRGWNFAGVSTNNPMDDNEHGTHVSGTIAGRGNNGEGVAGVSWQASILPVKFLTGGGSGTLEDAVKAIQYATLMNAKVMNNSWGGGGFTQTMHDAIVAARDKGLLFVAAAGNDSTNSDNSAHYPAGYQIDNVIAVAASTNRDTLARFSTYGKRTVHIAAPGHKIYSSTPNNSYDTFSGTSMATPHVAGALALVWSYHSGENYRQAKDRILRSRDFLPGLARSVMMSGRLNVYNALIGHYPPSPEPAESDWSDFAITPVESDHPYRDNMRTEWSFEAPADAKFVRVVFSRIELEEGYDFVKVLDASGAEMDSVSGAGANVASFYVPGNKVTLRFTTDSSVTKWGFKVEKLQIVR